MTSFLKFHKRKSILKKNRKCTNIKNETGNNNALYEAEVNGIF